MSTAIPTRVLEEAAEWFACLADPAAGDNDRRRWRAWVDAHPDHAEAWRRVDDIQSRIAPLAGTRGAARHALQVAHPARRRILKTLGVLLGAGGGALLAGGLPWREWHERFGAHQAALRSGHGEVRALALTDGTRLWLGTQSALDVGYGPRVRRIVLYQGDLLVQTAPDSETPARPFVVETPHGSLLALGTRFAVRCGPRGSRVDVFAGAVELAQSASGVSPHVVGTGRHAVFDGRSLAAGGIASPAREAWTRGLLLVDGWRLDELLDELARWHPTAIGCDVEVAGLRVVGAYPLMDLERTLALLEAGLPLVLRRNDRGLRLEKAAASLEGTFVPPVRIE